MQFTGGLLTSKNMRINIDTFVNGQISRQLMEKRAEVIVIQRENHRILYFPILMEYATNIL